jgi:hypothetical protein
MIQTLRRGEVPMFEAMFAQAVSAPALIHRLLTRSAATASR